MKNILLLFIACLLSAHVFAQDDLFGPKPKGGARKGWVFSVNGDFDAPGGDLAKRFGLSYRIGPSVFYKTTSNWMFGAKCDFIFGNKIKEDSLMYNIVDKYSEKGKYEFISANGERIGVPAYERGYLIGLQAGKIINISKKNADNGIMLLTAAGFIQHKIDIYDKDKSVPQLRDNYLKGYDRLTNGTFVEEYVAYTYFARDGLLNFHIGLDAMAAFTKGRRDYLYDVRRPDNANRIDMLFGIRGGWYLPIFRRKSEEIIFQ